MMHNIVHVEIPATDIGRAKEFYGKIFGWKFVDFDQNYSLFNTGSRSVGGGIYKVDSIPAQSPIRAYVLVDNVDATLTKIRTSGGTMTQPKGEVPGMGWYAGFKDPQGGEVWLWQRNPARQQKQRRRSQARKPRKRARRGSR